MHKNHSKADQQRDHYVPQTYLKAFSDPSKPSQVWRYWKSNPDNCKCVSIKSICCKPGGDYNPNFKNSRPADDYFKCIENAYGKALNAFENRNYNLDDKFCIALNIARMRFWTTKRKELYKTALGQHVEVLRKFLSEDLLINPEKYQPEIDIMNQSSKHSRPIDAKTMSEDLKSENIRLGVNQHYSDAILLRPIPIAGFEYYNMPWSLIHNESPNDFITSDNPVCTLEYPNCYYPETTQTNVYLPLTPRLAVLIHIIPRNVKLAPFLDDLYFSEEQVKKLNSTVVKFANEYVIANVKQEWVKNMVSEFRDYHEEYTEEIVGKGSDEDGDYQIKNIKLEWD